MAAPVTVTFTMQDGSTTVALAIPKSNTPSQFIDGLRLAGGFWDNPSGANTVTGSTWWPWGYVKKAVTS